MPDDLEAMFAEELDVAVAQASQMAPAVQPAAAAECPTTSAEAGVLKPAEGNIAIGLHGQAATGGLSTPPVPVAAGHPAHASTNTQLAAALVPDTNLPSPYSSDVKGFAATSLCPSPALMTPALAAGNAPVLPAGSLSPAGLRLLHTLSGLNSYFGYATAAAGDLWVCSRWDIQPMLQA